MSRLRLLLSLLFAATFSERVAALILFGISPRFTAAADLPDGVPTPVMELVVDAL